MVRQKNNVGLLSQSIDNNSEEATMRMLKAVDRSPMKLSRSTLEHEQEIKLYFSKFISASFISEINQ